MFKIENENLVKRKVGNVEWLGVERLIEKSFDEMDNFISCEDGYVCNNEMYFGEVSFYYESVEYELNSVFLIENVFSSIFIKSQKVGDENEEFIYFRIES